MQIILELIRQNRTRINTFVIYNVFCYVSSLDYKNVQLLKKPHILRFSYSVFVSSSSGVGVIGVVTLLSSSFGGVGVGNVTCGSYISIFPV